MRVVMAFIVGLTLWGVSAKAEGIRYDRMLMACGDTLMCQIIVESMAAADDPDNELYLRNKVSPADHMKIMHEHSELMRKYFPNEWKAQDCPMGQCDAFGGILPLAARQALREMRQKDMTQ